VGVFGPSTQRAVIEFQQRHRLSGAGPVDERTATLIG
jgi:peptidoglycan hydrolase-like protein with peptidoglycan-binding domain